MAAVSESLLGVKNPALPGLDPRSHVSEISQSVLKSYHLSMIFSLADGFREEAIDKADPALANNSRNLRDLDIGLFGVATEFVGRGATFSVHRTTFPDSWNVALKTRITDPKGDPNKSLVEKLEAILLELRVLSHPPLRNHPNIVQLMGVAWQGDAQDQNMKWPVLIVDYADKGSLLDVLESGPGLDFETKMSLFQDVCEGLHALHTCKVVHGDLKLDNVLVFTNNGSGCGCTAKLSDFGGALLDGQEGFQEPTGTPPWTAPEHKTKRPRGHLLLSDVYALGLLLWRILLDGQNPFLAPDGSLRPDMKQSDDFVYQIQSDLRFSRKFSSAQTDLVNAILESTVRLRPSDRSLDAVFRILHGRSARPR